MPLDEDIEDNEAGHIAAHEALHDRYNEWENYGPADFLRLATGGTVAGDLILADGGTAISSVIGDKLVNLDAWEEYTPTLTTDGVGADPTLGTGGRSIGYRARLGRFGIGLFGIRFGTSGQVRGSGTYTVATAYTGAGRLRIGGMTSDLVGFGTLWRGYNGLDLATGSHPFVHWHTVNDGLDNRILAIVQPGASHGSDVEEVKKTADQTGIGTTATDVSGLTVSVTPPRRGARYLVSADIQVWKSGGTATDPMFLQIVDEDGTVLQIRGCHAAVIGAGLGTGLVPVHLEFIDENPAVGDTRTYKVQAFTTASTMAVYGSATSPAIIRYMELPSMSTSGLDEPADYMSATYPWYWDDGNGGPEIWGLTIQEIAA